VALIHDAHAFDSAAFAAAVAEWIPDSAPPEETYRRLRDAALAAYDEHAHVRELASRYGGWDREALETQLPADAPEDEEDTGFWLTLLLYSYLRPTEPPAGLGERWSGLEDTLLVRGHGFEELPGVDGAARTALAHVHPAATAATAGWLAAEEVQRLARAHPDAAAMLPGVADSDLCVIVSG
jgi:hypothetical protein